MELGGLEPPTSWVRQGAHNVNVARLQGYLPDDRRIRVPKMIRSLREFTRVLARGEVRVAKPPDGIETARCVVRSPARFLAGEKPTLPLA
jgi:hypothetical protein